MFRFRKMKESDLEMVMRWRVQPDVTRYMLSDVEFNLENQRKWFEKIKTSSSAEYWIMENDSIPIGVLNLADIDRYNRRASWGYYIGEAQYRSLGGLVPAYFYNYVFARADLNLHKLVGKVVDGNENIMKIHDVFGCRRVGVYRDHVFKNNLFHDVHLVELLHENWIVYGKKFENYTASFE